LILDVYLDNDNENQIRSEHYDSLDNFDFPIEHVAVLSSKFIAFAADGFCVSKAKT